ncbi:MAG: hypothetical protein CMH35_00240 [Microbacterium sp.]|uniref:hypothetical protein n=1 Tax=Microbacterium sp. UBA3394 TaxID=1946945 RepID=UPI000C44BF94|nr:hypothetical protein [Microbacterium sp. UBA3394]MAB81684.1 hypothetical protein [Planctomycetota bacterium]MAM53282.1 hypothetical protein [Microbacterium sp.]|tara:strand:- start:167 stop:625 length:459 start_codon:yes stop_codon:yes gene_type:complete
MAVTPLTAAQQEAVDALVAGRRIDQVPADEARARAFLAASADRISQLRLLTSAGVKYDIAYDAAHDIGEALLAAHGYRTTNGPGQHEALGRFLRAVLDTPPGDVAARRFDRLRRTRNQSHYAAKPVGTADADGAERVARELHDAALSRGVGA